MMTKQPLNIEYVDKKEQELIKDSYRKLFYRDKYSPRVKILAAEFLAQYINQAEHREKLEYFYKQESDQAVKFVLQEILNGEFLYPEIKDEFYETVCDYLDAPIAETPEIIDERRKQGKETTKMLKAFRHSAFYKR